MFIMMQKHTRYNHNSFIGHRFHKLIVLSIDKNNGDVKCTCKCDCGELHIGSFYRIVGGYTKECSRCMRNSRSVRATKHKMSGSRIERIWSGMISRCYNKSSTSYRKYGALGIRVCDSWRYSASDFISWAIDNGYDDSLSLDRIDSKGNYSPENGRWVTQKAQCNNKSNNRVLEINGLKMTVSQWADKMGVPETLIRNRIDRLGWDVERSVLTPKQEFGSWKRK